VAGDGQPARLGLGTYDKSSCNAGGAAAGSCWALAGNEKRVQKPGGPRSQYRPSLVACFTREKSRSDGITQLLRNQAFTKNHRQWSARWSRPLIVSWNCRC